MKSEGFACFIRRPRRVEELLMPHPVEWETAYSIAKTVELGRMDYENFINDLLVERWFLEANPDEQAIFERRACILVRQKGSEDGILVQPAPDGYVAWAAYYAE